ncbi:MAG: TrbG/VirB9 family P-type conjugative transfer protein [Gammaproteobacteria bacterium]|nr:TrbG/VirB9 family P-type conjugative transfer protein [Gammaproteobacteria bacterium]
MRCVLVGSMIATLIAGCTIQRPSSYEPAQAVMAHPVLIDIPLPASFHLTYGNDKALEHAFNQYARNGTAPNIITDGFNKFAYNAGQQPIVQTAPFQETVISLEKGERFTNISSGDPNRWSYSVAVSGTGNTQQQNVLVKPSLPNMSTNMVITTDKRMYNIRLISSLNAKSAKNISFWYPDEMVAAVNDAAIKQFDDSKIASVPNVALNQLNFNYNLSCGFFCHLPAWSPTRVFDDGVHTYIQFKNQIANRDMPVLFIANGSTKELVNYRVKFPYFVVDKIFSKALLITGVGHAQSSVTITNLRYS